MDYEQLTRLFRQANKRFGLIGSAESGVVAALDLEGRLFAIHGGRVVSRVNADALTPEPPAAWIPPGGDGLWPAPEGTCFGYEYATGAWRVPPGIANARFHLTSSGANRAIIRAEIDLINSAGVGVPTAFERSIAVEPAADATTVRVVETIEYLGARTLERSECLLAPWTLSQFDAGPGCEVVFPAAQASAIWDLYEPSEDLRRLDGDLWHTMTEGSRRYQIGLGPEVPWIEFRNPAMGLRVRRSAAALPEGCSYIDIIDAPPDRRPSDKAVRYSVYSDADGFMEIEAAGGQPPRLGPSTSLALEVTTSYSTS